MFGDFEDLETGEVHHGEGEDDDEDDNNNEDDDDGGNERELLFLLQKKNSPMKKNILSSLWYTDENFKELKEFLIICIL